MNPTRGITARDLTAAVRAARLARGMTQQELASAAGVSRVWVARFETGNSSARLDTVLRVLNLLGISLDLATPTDPPGTQPSRPGDEINLDAIVAAHRR